ncbi:MAG: hypothetical protein AAF065_14575 [Verrucomicrobiota bacterium]
MELTDSQKTAVAGWIQENRSLADVQRLLREEFEISMTYMDVRFLVDDLDITMLEPDEESDDAPSEEAKPAEEADAELIEEGSGNVTVDVDAIMRPGSLVSGTVQFSDGKSLGWQLGASGQLGLIPDEDDAEYRPSPEDVQEFQVQLQEVLQKKGF